MTEVWFRDPYNYVRELIECGQSLIAWNRGLLVKRRIDPVAFCDMYYGQAMPWRALAIGDQGSAELGPGRGLDNPVAVYPTWTHGDEPAFLEEMMANPVGQSSEACFNASTPADERPVFGQEHRVVVTNIPKAETGMGRNFIRWIKNLQEDYPDCILHVHGFYSYRMAFGMGFGAADMEPRTDAQKGKINLASGGTSIPFEKVQKKAAWVTAMGMTPGDLHSPRMRCIFNIRSALWAGANYSKMPNVRLLPSATVDTETPDNNYKAPETKRALPVKINPQPGDKTLCNSCSLQMDCKQFRRDEVCSLTDGNAANLARFFKTRDSETIIDGLGTLLAMQATRLEYAAEEEKDLGDISPEVTRMINALFSQGVQLAKLVDPKLRTAPKVNVAVGVMGNGSATAISSTTPSELTAQVVRALEHQGIPRDKITPELVMATIQGMANPDDRHRAIEGTAIAHES